MKTIPHVAKTILLYLDPCLPAVGEPVWHTTAGEMARGKVEPGDDMEEGITDESKYKGVPYL